MANKPLKTIKFPGLSDTYTIPQVDDTLAVTGAAADSKTVGDILTDAVDRISAIEEAEGLKKYGVSGVGLSASALTRLWDSIGMTAQVGTDGDNSAVVNDFDHATPFNRRKCVGRWYEEDGRAVFHVNAYYGDEDYAEDGTMGDYVAVECPRAYYYMEGTTLGVSAHQYEGWQPFDIFCHKHNVNETIPYYYAPAYALALDENGHAVSLPGYDNVQGCYKDVMDAARTYDGDASSLAMSMPAAYNFYEWALFTVEFATQNAQNIMYGCASLRNSNDDTVTFVDATHVLTNNYYAGRVVGEYISIFETSLDINAPGKQASHRIVSITRCDEYGVANSSGTHQLIEVEDLGKEYYTYDTTGATTYKMGGRPYRTGATADVSTPSGSPVDNTSGYYPCRYRWHENPYGNQYKTTADLFNQRVGTGDNDYYLKWYYLTDPSTYTPSTTSKPDATDLATDKFVELNVQTAHANYVDGYIKSKKYSEEFPNIWIPYLTTGGSWSTFFSDYAYLVASAVVRSVRLGGHWSHGSYAGFSNANAAAAPSYATAHFGGELCFLQ